MICTIDIIGEIVASPLGRHGMRGTLFALLLFALILLVVVIK